MARTVDAVQADLTAFYSLRSQAAANGGIAEYSMDTGQGRQSVRRITLPDINATIRQLEAELLDAQSDGGPTIITFDRGAS